MNIDEAIKTFGEKPCGDALAWMGGLSLRDMWENCQRGDWMWWGLTKVGALTKDQAVAFARRCAEAAAAYASNSNSTSVTAGSTAVCYYASAASAANAAEAYADAASKNDVISAVAYASYAASAAAMAAGAVGSFEVAFRAYADEHLRQANWIRENIPYPAHIG